MAKQVSTSADSKETTQVPTSDQADQSSLQTPSNRCNGDSRPKRRSVTENLRQQLADTEAQLVFISRERRELQDQFDEAQKAYEDLSDLHQEGVCFRIDLQTENNQLRGQINELRSNLDQADRDLEVEAAVYRRLEALGLKAVGHVVSSVMRGAVGASNEVQKQAAQTIVGLIKEFGKSNPADPDCQC